MGIKRLSRTLTFSIQKSWRMSVVSSVLPMPFLSLSISDALSRVVDSRPSVVMTSWIHTRDQAYLGMCIRCVAYRISGIRRSAGLEIRSYGYGIQAEIHPLGIPGFYGIPTYFW